MRESNNAELDAIRLFKGCFVHLKALSLVAHTLTRPAVKVRGNSIPRLFTEQKIIIRPRQIETH